MPPFQRNHPLFGHLRGDPHGQAPPKGPGGGIYSFGFFVLPLDAAFCLQTPHRAELLAAWPWAGLVRAWRSSGEARRF